VLIKRFFSNSLIYAGSVLLFSVGRQIIFFPYLNKLSISLFETISFLVILFDFLMYIFGASLADYYVRKVEQNNKQYSLFKFLFFLSFLSFFSFFIFVYYEINYIIALLLTLYLLFYVLNTLQIKLFFNNLNFIKNYFYVTCRLLPYFLLLIYVKFFDNNSLIFFAVGLLISEIIVFFTF